MDDATFVAIMRRCLHGLAAEASETGRRHLLGMSEAFERRFGAQSPAESQPAPPRWLDAAAQRDDTAA